MMLRLNYIYKYVFNVFTGNNAALTTLTYPTHLSPIQIHSVTTNMDDQIHVWKSTHRKVRFKRTRTTQQLRQLKGANHWNKFVCHGILTTILFKELKVECCSSRNFWKKKEHMATQLSSSHFFYNIIKSIGLILGGKSSCSLIRSSIEV